MLNRRTLAVVAEVLLLIFCFAIVVYSSQVETKRQPPKRPADAVEDAQTPRAAPVARPEQRKTEADRPETLS